MYRVSISSKHEVKRLYPVERFQRVFAARREGCSLWQFAPNSSIITYSLQLEYISGLLDKIKYTSYVVLRILFWDST